MLVCYLDDSGKDPHNRVTTIAGYLARDTAWRAFEQEVEPIFERRGVKILHAKDLEATKGEFENWKVIQKQAFVAEISSVLAKHSMLGVSMSCVKETYDQRAKESTRKRTSRPYTFCMNVIIDWILRDIRTGRAAWEEGVAESAEHIAALGVQGDEARAELGVAQADIAKAKVQAAVQEKETAKARQAIVEANARAAEANARALEAQAALERFKAPRKLEGSQIERFKAAVAGFPGTPFDIMVNLESEPQGFAAQIGELLESVEWVWKDRNNTPGLAINIGKHQAGMLNGGPALGIEIDSSKDKDWAGAVLALGGAFLVEGIQPVMNKANDGSASPDAVHLYFGSKR